MTDTIRAALARLISASVAAWGSCNAQDKKYLSIEIARACAALAQPEPEVAGPTDEELLETLDKATADFPPRHPEAESLNAVEYPLALELRKARAVLARWGRPASADGPAVPEGRELAAVVGEASDQELLELMPETMRDEFSYAAKACSNATGGQAKPGIFRVCLNTAALEYARAVLARYGHQPAPPAEGEVAELVAALELEADAQDPATELQGATHAQLRRAADLLERLAAPVLEPALARINDILNDSGRIFQTDVLEALELARQALEQRKTAPAPVLVAERLPDASDPRECRMPDGSCWWFDPHEDGAWYFDTYQGNYTHWLRAAALPLPQGEVE